MIDAMHVKRSAIFPIIPAWPDVDGEVHVVVVVLAEEGVVAAAAADEDDEAVEDMPAPKFNTVVESVNETVRSGIPKLHNSNPGWLPSWERLIAVIRKAPHPVFWEIFSGKAGLTRAFLSNGWPCGPPHRHCI